MCVSGLLCFALLPFPRLSFLVSIYLSIRLSIYLSIFFCVPPPPPNPNRQTDRQSRQKQRDLSHLLEPQLQFRQLALLDHEGLVVEIFDDVVVFVLVDFEDDGFDGGVAFDEDACRVVGDG